jgi:general secretion pathway protein A
MYNDYFGFHEQPFNITPNPRFFYANPVHQEAYAGLLYGIRERKGCIALIGEAGTGKTTLLRKVMRDLAQTARTAFFYNTTLTFDELLDFICSDFELPVKEGRRLEKIQALNTFLLRQLREGGTGVLVIDEAQNLSNEVLENLRLLSNFETDDEKLLQIVLVGQPELEKKLERPELRQLKQRIAIHCRLDRLKAQDVGPFIHHRLRIAGCERQDLFTPEAIRRIAFYSEGIPRLINTICDNALLVAYGTAQQTIAETIIEEVAHDLLLRREETTAAREKTSKGRASREVWAAQQELTNKTDDVRPAAYVAATTPQNGREEAPQAPALSRSWVRPLTWVGIAIVLVLLLRVGSPIIFPQQTRARLADLSVVESRPPLEQKKDESSTPESAPTTPSPSSLPAAVQQAQDPRAEISAETKKEPTGPFSSTPPAELQGGEWKGESVTIARGDTMSAIVLKVYGTYNALAFDLIKEFNPHIEDLDRIAAGEHVWLPFPTRATLLRQQPDGSYHLIVGSFHSEAEAERAARKARRAGYTVTITPRRMSGTRLLHRVALEGLQDLATVERAWSLVGRSKS